jgi:hypothetical protein
VAGNSAVAEEAIWLPYRWEYGQHLALIGSTGSGKTAVESYLLRAHPYTIALKSKADTTRLPGRTIKRAKDIDNDRYNRFILDPDYERQREEFARVLEKAWRQGSWTIALDELYAIDNQLKLSWFVNRLLTQGRSNNLSVLMGMQRPKMVTRFALTQATHYIIFAYDGDDLRAILDETTPQLKNVIPSLQRYEFVWYCKTEKSFWRGNLQKLARKGRE